MTDALTSCRPQPYVFCFMKIINSTVGTGYLDWTTNCRNSWNKASLKRTLKSLFAIAHLSLCTFRRRLKYLNKYIYLSATKTSSKSAIKISYNLFLVLTFYNPCEVSFQSGLSLDAFTRNRENSSSLNPSYCWRVMITGEAI